MTGWIKVPRELLSWEWFTKPEMVQLFLYLLLSANHKAVKWQGIEIKRGEVVTSTAKISADTGLSVQVVRTCLNRLKSTNEITSRATSRYTIITICKYASYVADTKVSNKASNKFGNKQATNKQQTSNKQLTTNKNEKNEKNDSIYTHTEFISLLKTFSCERADTREGVRRMAEMAEAIDRAIGEGGDNEAYYRRLSNIDKGFIWLWITHSQLLDLFDDSCSYEVFRKINERYEVSDIKRIIAAMANKMPVSGERRGSFETTFDQWAVKDHQIAEKRRLGNPKYN